MAAVHDLGEVGHPGDGTKGNLAAEPLFPAKFTDYIILNVTFLDVDASLLLAFVDIAQSRQMRK